MITSEIAIVPPKIGKGLNQLDLVPLGNTLIHTTKQMNIIL